MNQGGGTVGGLIVDLLSHKLLPIAVGTGAPSGHILATPAPGRR